MSVIDKYFRLARKTALKGDTREASRQYRLGAVGVRSDGAIVTSSNIPHRTPEPQAHAEARLAKKLDWDATVYVVRIQSDGRLTTARPCKKCQNAMRLRGVKRCYFSVSENEYGVLEL
jgi:tRNA(Arg) A34 adenosine deaminase TadA